MKGSGQSIALKVQDTWVKNHQKLGAASRDWVYGGDQLCGHGSLSMFQLGGKDNGQNAR